MTARTRGAPKSPRVRGAVSPTLTLPDRPIPTALLRRRLREAVVEDWDFSNGRIFGSMCTQPLPEAVTASRAFLTANLGNPGLCPGTARLEEEVVSMLLDLFHGPQFGAGGWVLSGGTEANLTALWMARNASHRNEVVLPESAHFSFVKALDLLQLEPKWVPLDAAGRSRPEEVRRAISSRTAAVVAVAGSTELGAVDPVREIGEIAADRGVPLHVDAAFGGFVLPWLPGAPGFDLGLTGVTSLTVDPHKMGLAPVPAGVLLVRHREMSGSISVASPYLSSPQTTGLLGTRASSAVAATYAALLSLGRQGYSAQAARTLRLTRKLLEGGRRWGLEPVVEPTVNIVAFHHPNPMGVQTWMLERGWDVSSIRTPSALRFVVMPHASDRSISGLLRYLGRALERFPASRRG
ncbi:MAG: tyrosine decarboxylase MfnA [Euryarchaeota archaeon]|nr:tyrosine decarboxylase MfnA [Euryarchaeota archaeon]MDE1835103.1 tyrosine decarboxylase MfnA [Euryarchaeota archaeon]MDE1879375.1 tyrosine decarboxylase MfnA [Euryarchaeota archaeon]MDE2044934.1 tyrosine decarboxylase MfnA [Thermoplasmata archaeon]